MAYAAKILITHNVRFETYARTHDIRKGIRCVRCVRGAIGHPYAVRIRPHTHRAIRQRLRPKGQRRNTTETTSEILPKQSCARVLLGWASAKHPPASGQGPRGQSLNRTQSKVQRATGAPPGWLSCFGRARNERRTAGNARNHVRPFEFYRQVALSRRMCCGASGELWRV